MAKISESKKVELLEAAIGRNDLDAVRVLYGQYGSFEFTPRALSLACCKGSPEMVRFLCEQGASFRYTCTPVLARKYDCKIATSNRDSYPRDYNQNVVVGRACEIDPAVSFASGEIRRANLAVLWEFRDSVGLDAQEMLFHALLWQDDDLVQGLKDLGVTKLTPYRADMAAGRMPHNRLDSLGRAERSRFGGAFRREPALVADFVQSFADILGGERIHLFKSDIMEYDSRKGKDVLYTSLCGAQVFPTLERYTDFTAVAKQNDILYAFVEESNAEGLAWAMAQGWVEEKEKKALLKYAQKLENASAPLLAVLLSGSEPEEAAAPALELSLTPSAAELKKIWSTKKLEDGTLMITGYKGEALDVVIPHRIGKFTVTALGSDVFNPMAPRVTREQAEVRQNLQAVEIPGTVAVIPDRLFGSLYGTPQWNLPNLRRVVLGEGVREIGICAFTGCTGLEEVVFPQSLTKLEYGAFHGCKALQAVHLPENVSAVGYGAFDNCTSLKELTLPQSAEVKTNSFSGCFGLQDENGMVIVNGCFYHYCGTARKLAVPEGVTAIGIGAFTNNAALEEIVLPRSLKILEGGAFTGCKSLRRVEIPQGVEELMPRVFRDCEALESVTIPAGVKMIHHQAFAGCSALTKVELPASLQEIGNGAFLACAALEEIHIPAGVHTIGDRFAEEFRGCDRLTIYAPAGSAAESYAKKRSIPFVAEP